MTMVIGDRLAFGGMCAVPVYLFYIFEKDGHVTGSPTIYELPNDATALKEAKRFLTTALLRFGGTSAKSVASIPRHNRVLSPKNFCEIFNYAKSSVAREMNHADVSSL
jgi:hypothetical protein